MDTTTLIEQRREPRFRTNFAAGVTSFRGDRSPARVTNLSLSGLQLTGDHRLMHTLMPNIRRENPHLPISFSVHFRVPTTTTSVAAIDLGCKLVYCRRRRTNLFVLGCNFTVFEDHCEEDLREYIEHFGQRL